ncbi:MAG: carboxylating nicotinate-nucleotide diphosphorylase [Planctomycetota bacterium]
MLDVDSYLPQLRAALAEDVGPGDVTGELMVPEDARATARVVAKAAGVLAGVQVAHAVFVCAREGTEATGAGSWVDAYVSAPEGARLVPGDRVLELGGNARALLRAERTALNFLMRLSGIATLTARFVAAVTGTGARILDTRKTTPGWRAFEKYAVRVGGGHNHRFALFDEVLAKENHLVFGTDLKDALAARPAGMPAIVEAETLAEFHAAMAAGCDVVLLDDVTPEEVAEARRARGAEPRPLLEVSGGITLKNVRAYADAGAERISVGALTHSAPALDLSCAITPSA